MIKKNNLNLDLENVEKVLVKNLENKKDKKYNYSNNIESRNDKNINFEDFSEETIDFIKSFVNDNQISNHFDRKIDTGLNEIINVYKSNKANNFKHDLKFYNQKIGEYIYNFFDNKVNNKGKNESKKDKIISFPRTSLLSKPLFDKAELLDNIIPEKQCNYPQKKIDLKSEDFFDLRLFKYLNNYSDISISNSDLFLRQNLMNIYIFHIINHILIRKEEIEINNLIENVYKKKMNKSINNILKEELLKNPEEDFLLEYTKNKELTNFTKNEYFKEYSYDITKIKKLISSIKNTTDESGNVIYEHIKDQGYTFPRVLILVPYKKHARLIIDEIVSILRNGNWKGIKNKKKFKEEYSETDAMNDCFRIGIKFDYFQNKLTFYESFEESDLIIASPLGVKLTKNSDGGKQEKIYDFLSSLEILLVDFSEVFTFQNIAHLEEILNILNKVPKSNSNIVDINRIKENYKENLSEYLRQSIFVSHFKSLEIEMLMKNYCKNIFEGTYNFVEKYQNILFEKNSIELDLENSKKGNIENEIYDSLNLNSEKKVAKAKVINESDDEDDFKIKLYQKTENMENNKIKFEFKMLRSFDNLDILDNKFNFFTKNLWPNIIETFERHTIIFTASALDYIRLKSFFKKNSIYVTFISEETDKKDWQRNRLFFEEGRYKFLLYSERAHYYKKINLRFAKNIFYYSLPEDPKTMKEMLELIKPSHYKYCLDKYKIDDQTNLADNYSAVISLVTKLEKYNLEKAVGTETANHIFKNKIENYMC